MKLPWLPVYILTEDSLKKIKDKAIRETRRLSEKQVAGLLRSNAMLSALVARLGKKLGYGTKKKKKGSPQ